MDIVLYIESFIQGLVQGFTEFLPISSTGHLIIVDRLMELVSEYRNGENFKKMFDVVIQFGSILAVIIYFHKKLIPREMFRDQKLRKATVSIWMKTVVGVLPAILIGALLGGKIQEYLFNPLTVAIALIVGGIVLIVVDSRTQNEEQMLDISQITYAKAFGIGMIQCLAMVPGTSRSASTIIGGMCLGASRPLAAEYSFFLAIPTMFAASCYSLMKYGAHLNKSEWIALAIGLTTAFFVAWGVIAMFMAYIKTRSFKPFGWYRIGLGTLIIFLLYFRVL